MTSLISQLLWHKASQACTAWSGDSSRFRFLAHYEQKHRKLRSDKVCLETSAIRNEELLLATRLCNEKKGACLVEDNDGPSSLGEWRAVLFSACFNKGCEACAHAGGCEQLLLSSIFLYLLFGVVVVGFSCFQL